MHAQEEKPSGHLRPQTSSLAGAAILGLHACLKLPLNVCFSLDRVRLGAGAGAGRSATALFSTEQSHKLALSVRSSFEPSYVPLFGSVAGFRVLVTLLFPCGALALFRLLFLFCSFLLFLFNPLVLGFGLGTGIGTGIGSGLGVGTGIGIGSGLGLGLAGIVRFATFFYCSSFALLRPGSFLWIPRSIYVEQGGVAFPFTLFHVLLARCATIGV